MNHRRQMSRAMDKLYKERYPLHHAARIGDLKTLKRHIEQGMSVDSFDNRKFTPLHHAAMCGELKIAEYLISNNCNRNLESSDNTTPLFLAVCKGHKAVVELLLTFSPHISGKIAKWSILHHASQRGWIEVVRHIVENRDEDLDGVKFCGLIKLIMSENWGRENIAELLIRERDNINFCDVNMFTALHWASSKGWLRVVKLILEKGEYDINAINKNGDTALHLACKGGHTEIMKLLLNVDADVNVRNKCKETAFTLGRKNGSLNAEAIILLIQNGLYFQNNDQLMISFDELLRERILQDVELCTQIIVNRFNNKSLPAIHQIPGFFEMLPSIDNLTINCTKSGVAREIANFVESDIQRNLFCNVEEARPIALKLMCVQSLTDYQEELIQQQAIMEKKETDFVRLRFRVARAMRRSMRINGRHVVEKGNSSKTIG